MATVAFFGLPLAAYLLLRDGHRIAPCVLSPVNSPGRRRVRRMVEERFIVDALALLPGQVEAAVDGILTGSRPDLLVSWYWTRLLPRRWLDAPRIAALGVHPSLLPRHRGADPFYWAIDCGDAVTGVTAHLLTEEYDAGAILVQQELPIGTRNAWQLARALDRPSLSLLRRVVSSAARGQPIDAVPQDPSAVTWAEPPRGDDLRVDFHWNTERVLRRIRALSPVPGLPLEVRGLSFVVTGAEPARGHPAVLLPGEAAILQEPPRLVIVTGDGAIAVTSAELSSGGEEPRTLGASELAEAVAARPPGGGPGSGSL